MRCSVPGEAGVSAGGPSRAVKPSSTKRIQSTSRVVPVVRTVRMSSGPGVPPWPTDCRPLTREGLKWTMAGRSPTAYGCGRGSGGPSLSGPATHSLRRVAGRERGGGRGGLRPGLPPHQGKNEDFQWIGTATEPPRALCRMGGGRFSSLGGSTPFAEGHRSRQAGIPARGPSSRTGERKFERPVPGSGEP